MDAAVPNKSDATRIESLEVDVYVVPTDAPETDGTLSWDSTTLVLVRVHAGGASGLGYTYTDRSAATLIRETLAGAVCGRDAFDVPAAWRAMNAALRNVGRPGLGLMAIAAVDHALWDLKARLLDRPLLDLWGRARNATPAYGSGGFTSYDLKQLTRQLGGWVEQGLPQVKMKVGSAPQDDPQRVHAAREAVGDDVELMVDANGAYSRKQALMLAQAFAAEGVCWLEEPVSSDDLEGLRLLRDRAPAEIDITAGEYGWDVWYFRRMLAAGAVDVLQIDSTRCGGFTGFMQCADIAAGFGIEVSAHCAPSLHAQVCGALNGVRHIEYFHDHVRIESMLFDGLPTLQDGRLRPDPSRPGLGLELRVGDAERYRLQ